VLALALATAAACNGGHDAPSTPTNAATPDRLVVLGNGAVLDPRTRLEWTSRDHERSLPWEEADRYCRGLAASEQREWRLPEITELEALYDSRFDEPCGDRTCHLDPAIRLGGPYVWSVTTRGAGTRFYFDAGYGNSFSPSLSPRLVRRVLCVRTAAGP
jgi:hypothetical protein